MTIEGACGVPRSQRLRETTRPTLQRSKTSGGLTTSGDDRKTTRAAVSPTFHTYWLEATEFEKSAAISQDRLLRMTFG